MRGGSWQALLFLLPALALVGFTFIYPVYSLIRMSLFQSLGDLSLYVGFDNYAVVLSDPLFRTSIRNNLVLMACVPIMIVIALVLALLLYEQRKAAPLYRFILFTPYIISITVSGIAFSAMLTRNGALNQMLEAAGLGFLRQDWLGDPKIALLSVGAVIIWRESVLGVVLFSARPLTLSTEPLEAAMVDGADRWRAHWAVTLPQMRGIIGFYAITSIITVAVWTFSYVFVMTNGGPGNATMTADLYIYQNAFAVAQMNLAASAATVVLVAAIGILAVSALATVGDGETARRRDGKRGREA
jgi:ABC-type sugar transport system permease subunit